MSKYKVKNLTFGTVDYKNQTIYNFIIVDERDNELADLEKDKLVKVSLIKDEIVKEDKTLKEDKKKKTEF
jgi:hypothetical protein